MAGSLMERLRERLDRLQHELQPDAGFDRSAYGYEEERDATFEDVELEEESPWRRPAAGAPPPEPDAAGTGDAPRSPRGRMERAAAVVPPRTARAPRPAAAPPKAPDSPWARGGRSAGGVGGDVPSPSPWERPAPGSPRDGPSPALRGFERRNVLGMSRLQRIRGRIQHPDSLRELFLLREVIDRPVALRRPRARR